MLEESERLRTPLSVLPAIATLMDQWIARGHAKDDWMVIARVAMKRSP
jgi:3-hydroxyisobutyrate dehydrogenase